MEWWSILLKVRKVVYGFIAIASLGWSIVLSIYLVREWSHFLWSQRGIVLSMIAVNFITALLLYLMIVVIFRYGLEFARVVFLLLIHVGSTLAFTLFSNNFSCAPFTTQAICKEVDLAFIIGSWVLTGLLLGYLICLLMMIRVPRPLPKLTPNLLLDDPEMSQQSARASLRSVDSATALLRQESQRSIVSPPSTATTSRTWTAPMDGYGATSPSPRTGLRRPSQASFSRTRRQSSTRGMPPRPLPLPNPFQDPLPRNGTPDSMVSSLTFSTDQQHTNPAWSKAMGMNKYQPVVPMSGAISAFSSAGTRRSPSMTSADPLTREILNASPESMYGPEPPLYPSTNAMPSQQYQQYGSPTTVWSAGTSLRQHTTTPHSVHSLAPSMHLTHDSQHSAPAVAHTRGPSDPVHWRPSTVEPAAMRTQQSQYPMTAGAPEVRRFGTMPNAQYYAGRGATYAPARNADHLAGALGRRPPRTAGSIANQEEWRQLVMKAAAGPSM